MAALDSIKQIIARPARDGRGTLEITLESGALIHKEIPFDPFMKAIADILKTESGKRTPEIPAAPEIGSPS
jgi:hypothetical protein